MQQVPAVRAKPAPVGYPELEQRATNRMVFAHGMHDQIEDGTDRRTPELRRVLTFWPLVFYGLGIIVGAGIYVAIGAVMERAGGAAPLSFLLAGIAAAATGLCYAEMASRFPEAAGAVSYVRHGFGSERLALATGIAIALAVTVAAASIAHGAVHYLSVLVPLPAMLLIIVLVVGFTGIAVLGVGASVGLAALLGMIEIAGLVVATIAGLAAAPDYHLVGMVPADLAGWRGMAAGAFLAFFSFIGFETLANLAEEVKEPRRTVPRGILGAVGASVVLYLAVSMAAVLADSPAGNPLINLFSGRGASAFAAIGALAVANGVLVEIMMLARLFYGMARNGQLPAVLGQVHPHTQTPIVATALAGVLVLMTALLVPFEHLLVLANAVTLAVFALVDLALWRVQRRSRPVPGGFAVPRWLPLSAAALSLALVMIALVDYARW
jgi:basic amino acid/polyamine antiporter, APA family